MQEQDTHTCVISFHSLFCNQDVRPISRLPLLKRNKWPVRVKLSLFVEVWCNRNVKQNRQHSNQHSQLVLALLDPAPGQFMEQNTFCPNSENTTMLIVEGREKEAKGKPANAAY